MSVFAHIDSLNKKHETLKKEIRLAYTHHLPDENIATLKKKKLQVKDEIKGIAVQASNQA